MGGELNLIVFGPVIGYSRHSCTNITFFTHYEGLIHDSVAPNRFHSKYTQPRYVAIMCFWSHALELNNIFTSDTCRTPWACCKGAPPGPHCLARCVSLSVEASASLPSSAVLFSSSAWYGCESNAIKILFAWWNERKEGIAQTNQ